MRGAVLRYHRRAAQRLQAVAAGLAAPDTDPLVFVIVVELGDRIMDLTFRDRGDPDPAVIRHGRVAITAYLAAVLRSSPLPSGAVLPSAGTSPPALTPTPPHRT